MELPGAPGLASKTLGVLGKNLEGLGVFGRKEVESCEENGRFVLLFIGCQRQVRRAYSKITLSVMVTLSVLKFTLGVMCDVSPSGG